MKKTIALLTLSAIALGANAQKTQNTAQQVQNPKEVTNAPQQEQQKLLNPAEHDPSSGLHYGQQRYGVSAYVEPQANSQVGGMGNQLPSGREQEVEKTNQLEQIANAPPKHPEKVIVDNPNMKVPVYERMNLFNSYLRGVVENVVPIHINQKLLTSVLDLPQGDLLVDVSKIDDNNIRAFALIIKLSDGSQTSVFQADRGENFKVGELVQAPIILTKTDFIVGTFKKIK